MSDRPQRTVHYRMTAMQTAEARKANVLIKTFLMQLSPLFFFQKGNLNIKKRSGMGD
jgi:hypothetical protein